ncbi:MAG: flagellar hook assembly protein FlgD [Rhodoferax sp.]|nr:flagellar hook assembly protein FlgD [Rhodoferax sp.]
MLTSNVNPNTSPDYNSALYSSSTTNKPSQTDAAASQDRFLKLLVAQLNNQDPMNPMDNAQMTSQMAQINTVSGIQQVNASIKAMATQFSAMQVLQGASMIGREVLTEGNKLTIQNGVGKGALELAGSADKVTVQVMTAGGQLLGTVNLGQQEAGRHSFEWDASTYTGSSTPIFKVIATQGTAAVGSTALTRNTVESVSADANGMTLALKGAGTVAYDAVKAIL